MSQLVGVQYLHRDGVKYQPGGYSVAPDFILIFWTSSPKEFILKKVKVKMDKMELISLNPIDFL